MNKVQSEELRILIEFDRIARKHKLKYSLAYGTLIGAIRHQGFIPWDDDVDVIMLRSEYEKLKSILKSELASDMIFVDHTTEDKYYLSFGKIRSKNVLMPESSTNYLGAHQGVWVDIFPYDGVSDDKELALKQKKSLQRYHDLLVYSVFVNPYVTDSLRVKVVKSLFHGFNKATKNFTALRRRFVDKINFESTRYNRTSPKYYNALSVNFTELEYSGSMLTKAQLNDLIEVKFEGYSFYAIADYDKYLKVN